MERNMFKFERTLNTNGKGYWSNVIAPVNTTKLTVDYINDEGDFGELRVHFDNSWVVKTDGLIYTDSQFIKELRKELTAAGLEGKDVDYSEQGMQGNDYVSLDVGKKFLKSWLKKIEALTPSL
jgi:hypothetical protein